MRHPIRDPVLMLLRSSLLVIFGAALGGVYLVLFVALALFLNVAPYVISDEAAPRAAS